MCVWCEGPASLDGFGVEHRPGARLAGLRWSGNHAGIVDGALADTLVRVRERLLEEQAFRPGPILVLTHAGQGDAATCFAGGRLFDDCAAPAGLEELTAPAADYAVASHHRSEGDVIDRYGAILDWMKAERLERDRSCWRHREEYPLHADFARPETVRLMVPVVLPHEDPEDVTPPSEP